jgi:hypothetical protein
VLIIYVYCSMQRGKGPKYKTLFIEILPNIYHYEQVKFQNR